MKKYSLTLLITLIITLIPAFGKGSIKLISGSTDVLKQTANATLEIDYTDATWEKDETYKQWCGPDYQERINISKEAFTKTTNNVSKSLKINNDNPKYKIYLKIIDLEQDMGFPGSFSFRITATMDIIDLKTKKNLCSLQIKKVEGEADFVPNDRIYRSFAELATLIFKKNKIQQ